MATPLGLFYQNIATPCWGFASRQTLIKNFGKNAAGKDYITIHHLNTSLRGDGGSYTISPDFRVADVEKELFQNDLQYRIRADDIEAAILRIKNNESLQGLLLDVPQKKCTKCYQEKPVNDESFEFIKSRKNYKAQCRECHNKQNLENHGKRRDHKRSAEAFICTACNTTCLAKDESTTYSQKCKSCVHKEVRAQQPLVRGLLGVFHQAEPTRAIWKFHSRYALYKAIGVHQRGVDEALDERGFWKYADKSPYAARCISQEDFDAILIDPGKTEEVINAMKTGCEVHNTLAETPKQKCQGKNSCGRILDQTREFFSEENGKLRITCRECRARGDLLVKETQRQEAEAKGVFLCTSCKEMHPVSARMPDRNQCTDAYLAGRREERRTSNRTPENTIRGPCCGCKKPFVRDRTIFIWGQNKWQSLCRDCHNRKASERPWRLTKRREDEVSYLKYNADQQRKYHKEHPEIRRKRNEKRRACADEQIKGIRRKAKGRTFFNQAQTADLASMLDGPCFYCGIMPPEGETHGLDRPSSQNDHYCIDRVVTCCAACNRSKWTDSPSEFVERSKLIAENALRRQYPLSNVPPTEGLDGHIVAVWGRKRGQKDNVVRTPGLCYLCGIETMVGKDRVDSTLSYEIPQNVRACCRPCNFLKREYALDRFVGQCVRIHSRFTADEAESLSEMLETECSCIIPSENEEEEQEKPQRLSHRPPRGAGILVYERTTNLLVAKYHKQEDLENAIGRSLGQLMMQEGEHVAEDRTVNNALISYVDLFDRWRIWRVSTDHWEAQSPPTQELTRVFETSFDDQNLRDPLVPIRKKQKAAEKPCPIRAVISPIGSQEPIAVFENRSDLIKHLDITPQAFSKATKDSGLLKGLWTVRYISSNMNPMNREGFSEEYKSLSQRKGMSVLIEGGGVLLAKFETMQALATALIIPTSTLNRKVNDGTPVLRDCMIRLVDIASYRRAEVSRHVSEDELRRLRI